MKLNEIRTPRSEDPIVVRMHGHGVVVRELESAKNKLEGFIDELKRMEQWEEGADQVYEKALSNLNAAISLLTLNV